MAVVAARLKDRDGRAAATCLGGVDVDDDDLLVESALREDGPVGRDGEGMTDAERV